MTVQGTIIDGSIVLDEKLAMADGTKVQVEVQEAIKPNTDEDGPFPLRGLLKYAGVITDMPADFAENHDHYIHGTPKK